MLLVLPHELAHALVGLALGSPTARVTTGGPTLPLHGRIGRLSLELRPLSWGRWTWYGVASCSLREPTRVRRIAVLAAGPSTSAVLALGYAAVALTSSALFVRTVFAVLALGGALTFVVTALPLRYGAFFGPYAGSESDGRRILALLQTRHVVTPPHR